MDDNEYGKCLNCGKSEQLRRGLCSADYQRFQRQQKRLTPDAAIAYEQLLIDAKKLLPNKNRNALQTVGYSELFDYFDGLTTLEFAIEEIKKNTRRFSKRQMTWFKRTENATWFDFRTDRKLIVEHSHRLML